MSWIQMKYWLILNKGLIFKRCFDPLKRYLILTYRCIVFWIYITWIPGYIERICFAEIHTQHKTYLNHIVANTLTSVRNSASNNKINMPYPHIKSANFHFNPINNIDLLFSCWLGEECNANTIEWFAFNRFKTKCAQCPELKSILNIFNIIYYLFQLTPL